MSGWFFGPKHTLEQLYSDRHLFARRPRARNPETCYVSRCFCYIFLVSGTARAHLWESVICCMFLLVSRRVDWSCRKQWICVISVTIPPGFQLLFDIGVVCAGTIIPDAYLTRDFTYFSCTAEPLAQPFWHTRKSACLPMFRNAVCDVFTPERQHEQKYWETRRFWQLCY